MSEYPKIERKYINHRLLLRRAYCSTYEEYLVLEISPSNEYFRVTAGSNPDGYGVWKEIEDYWIIEDLGFCLNSLTPNKDVKVPKFDILTEGADLNKII